MANLANYNCTLASENVPNPPLLSYLVTLALPTPAPVASTLPLMPQSPTTTPMPPTVGVRVANGRPECSVASATLALASSFPQAAMSGHVTPSFPHTLVPRLQHCFYQDSSHSLVYHPNDHPILSGWRWTAPLPLLPLALPSHHGGLKPTGCGHRQNASAAHPVTTVPCSASIRCHALALTSPTDCSATRSSSSQPRNPSHQHFQGHLLSLLHIWCSPDCRLGIPCCRYSVLPSIHKALIYPALGP